MFVWYKVTAEYYQTNTEINVEVISIFHKNCQQNLMTLFLYRRWAEDIS